jgi:hypothetical protein
MGFLIPCNAMDKDTLVKPVRARPGTVTWNSDMYYDWTWKLASDSPFLELLLQVNTRSTTTNQKAKLKIMSNLRSWATQTWVIGGSCMPTTPPNCDQA